MIVRNNVKSAIIRQAKNGGGIRGGSQTDSVLINLWNFVKGIDAFGDDPVKWIEDNKDNPWVNALMTLVPGLSAASIAKALLQLKSNEMRRLSEEKRDIEASSKANNRLQSLTSIESALHGAARSNVAKDIKNTQQELKNLAQREAQRNRESQFDYTKMYNAGNLPGELVSQTLNSLTGRENK